MSIFTIIAFLPTIIIMVMGKNLYLSKHFFINEEIGSVHGGLLVGENGTIDKIFTSDAEIENYKIVNNDVKIIDFKNKVLMPGLIDSHVHINEPGRKDWEGFLTATKSAAAGGFTTIADMPLNSIPATTSVSNLKKKLDAAKGKIFVDVAFWGGLISDNIDHLQDLINNGVVGFKCFLCPSGIEEFSNVNEQQIEEALKRLENTGTVVAFHAEIEPEVKLITNTSQPEKYETYLKSRPPSMEIEAVEMISKLALKYNVKLHIVHLSTADAIPTIRNCQRNGGNLTAETCHHYLSLTAEEVPDYHTEFKCSPPIRDKLNQQKLWQAIIEDQIYQVVSDHSPSTAEMKFLLENQLERGNFLKAWGGIASNQFGLSLLWTNGQKYGLQMKEIYKLMSLNPSKLMGINNRKGLFKEGYDADFCVWDPNEEFLVKPEIIQFKNKITPYMNVTLHGRVHFTFVRGQEVFNISKEFNQPVGEFVFRKY